jgi:hypothetical protein
MARLIAPKIALCAGCSQRCADDEQAVDEDADDDRRHTVENIQHDAEERGGFGPRVLRDVDGNENRDRNGQKHRHADDQGTPDQSVGDATLLAEEGGGPGEEGDVELADPLEENRSEHEPEQCYGEQCAENGRERDELFRAPSARKIVRSGGDVIRVGDLGGAHPVDILRAFWNLFTITCAATFETSEITIKIAPRYRSDCTSRFELAPW